MWLRGGLCGLFASEPVREVSAGSNKLAKTSTYAFQGGLCGCAGFRTGLLGIGFGSWIALNQHGLWLVQKHQNEKRCLRGQGILVDWNVHAGFAEFEADGTAAALREYGVGIAYPSSSVPWAPS